MSGHSKWKQIKHKKEAVDKKRSQLFSKLLGAIRIAARGNTHPDFNPRLRAAIDKARSENVPQDNIDRALVQAAIQKAEELTVEIYGPGGIAIIATVVTDSRNRSIAEIRKITSDHEGKIAEPGSVLWAFTSPQELGGNWEPKFPQEVDESTKSALHQLVISLEDHSDVTGVYTNAVL